MTADFLFIKLLELYVFLNSTIRCPPPVLIRYCSPQPVWLSKFTFCFRTFPNDDWRIGLGCHDTGNDTTNFCSPAVIQVYDLSHVRIVSRLWRSVVLSDSEYSIREVWIMLRSKQDLDRYKFLQFILPGDHLARTRSGQCRLKFHIQDHAENWDESDNDMGMYEGTLVFFLSN